MQQKNGRSASPQRLVRTPDALTRDAGRVQVRPHQKLLSQPAEPGHPRRRQSPGRGPHQKLRSARRAATRDSGKVRQAHQKLPA
jgi:hypothetical protein